jgi:hypothetical protein
LFKNSCDVAAKDVLHIFVFQCSILALSLVGYNIEYVFCATPSYLRKLGAPSIFSPPLLGTFRHDLDISTQKYLSIFLGKANIILSPAKQPKEIGFDWPDQQNHTYRALAGIECQLGLALRAFHRVIFPVACHGENVTKICGVHRPTVWTWALSKDAYIKLTIS